MGERDPIDGNVGEVSAMTKTCQCGKEFDAKGRWITCSPECSHARLKNKMRSRMYTVRHDLYGPLMRDRIVYKVTVKCPRCPDGHDLRIIEFDYKPRMMPRLYCDRHAALKTAHYCDAWNGTLVRI